MEVFFLSSLFLKGNQKEANPTPKIVDEKKSKPNATKYTRMACPDNQKWHFSKNHWQDEQTFKQYLMDIVIPYRLEMLDTTNRNESQKLILILDLHWSHKTQYIIIGLSQYISLDNAQISCKYVIL